MSNPTATETRAAGENLAAADPEKCHPSCTYGKPEAGPICRKHQAEIATADAERSAKDQAIAEEKTQAAAAPAPNPLDSVKFPPLDNLGSHFYDNEAGTFWVGLNLRNDPMILALTLDGAKMPMVQAALDFRGREARRASLITRVKESAGGMKEGLEKMLGRVAGGAKSILSR